ncbi:hypothetical protein [Paenibacillus marinisediminis]
MSEEKEKDSKFILPNSVVDLLILDTFKRNGADTAPPTEPLPDHERQMLRNLVTDLSKQVDGFVKAQKKNEENIRKATLDPANIEYVNQLKLKAAIQEEEARREKEKEAAPPPAKERERERERGRERERSKPRARRFDEEEEAIYREFMQPKAQPKEKRPEPKIEEQPKPRRKRDW